MSTVLPFPVRACDNERGSARDVTRSGAVNVFTWTVRRQRSEPMSSFTVHHTPRVSRAVIAQTLEGNRCVKRDLPDRSAREAASTLHGKWQLVQVERRWCLIAVVHMSSASLRPMTSFISLSSTIEWYFAVCSLLEHRLFCLCFISAQEFSFSGCRVVGKEGFRA